MEYNKKYNNYLSKSVYKKNPKNFDEAVNMCTKLADCKGITYKKNKFVGYASKNSNILKKNYIGNISFVKPKVMLEETKGLKEVSNNDLLKEEVIQTVKDV